MKKTKEERLFNFLEKILKAINRENSGEAVHITEVVTTKEVEKLIKDFGLSFMITVDKEKVKKEALTFIKELEYESIDDYIGFEDDGKEWAEDSNFNSLETKMFLKEIKNILKRK